METHPLLQNLLRICDDNGVERYKAYAAYELYLQLSKVRNLKNLQCLFHEELQIFYLTGRKEAEEINEVYISTNFHSVITPEEIDSLQKNLCPNKEQFFIVIKDKDSSFTSYCISKGLPKTNSNFTVKKKLKKHISFQCDSHKDIKKLLYSKSLNPNFKKIK